LRSAYKPRQEIERSRLDEPERRSPSRASFRRRDRRLGVWPAAASVPIWSAEAPSDRAAISGSANVVIAEPRSEMLKALQSFVKSAPNGLPPITPSYLPRQFEGKCPRILLSNFR
jgi:hypothetical protein